MTELLQLEEIKCTACYSCVKACPVKAVCLTKDNAIPTIDTERCIGCGECINACSYGAITPVSEIEQIENMLHSEQVVAICDPSIAGEFKDISDYRKFVNMLRALGFKYVCEVSFGVDVIARNDGLYS